MKDLKKSEFKRLLADGYGNALRFLNSCGDPMKYEKIIAQCCTTNTCFDMQCEGDRGAYLCEAVMLTGQSEYFCDIVMKKLARSIDGSWNTLQMSNFLVCLYRECNDSGLMEKISDFFNEIYIREIGLRSGKRFVYKGSEDGFEDLCTSLFNLNEAYFERIVNDVGGIMLRYPRSKRFSMDWFISRCTDGGKKRGRLKKADPECARVFTEKFDIDWEAVRREASDIDELLAGENGSVLKKSQIVQSVLFRRAVRQADDDELLRLAENAAAERDESKKRFMLAAFEKKPFPLGLGAVMEMYREGGEDIREQCLEIMGQFPGKEASVFALEEARCMENPADIRAAALDAYVMTAEIVDVDILVPLVSELDSYEEKQNKNVLLHNLGFSFQERRDKHSRRYERLRRYFYNNLRCTCCRMDTVQMMVRSRDDCGDILQECCYDCNLDLRKYARGVLTKRKINRKDDI